MGHDADIQPTPSSTMVWRLRAIVCTFVLSLVLAQTFLQSLPVRRILRLVRIEPAPEALSLTVANCPGKQIEGKIYTALQQGFRLQSRFCGGEQCWPRGSSESSRWCLQRVREGYNELDNTGFL